MSLLYKAFIAIAKQWVPGFGMDSMTRIDNNTPQSNQPQMSTRECCISSARTIGARGVSLLLVSLLLCCAAGEIATEGDVGKPAIVGRRRIVVTGATVSVSASCRVRLVSRSAFAHLKAQ